MQGTAANIMGGALFLPKCHAEHIAAALLCLPTGTVTAGTPAAVAAAAEAAAGVLGTAGAASVSASAAGMAGVTAATGVVPMTTTGAGICRRGCRQGRMMRRLHPRLERWLLLLLHHTLRPAQPRHTLGMCSTPARAAWLWTSAESWLPAATAQKVSRLTLTRWLTRTLARRLARRGEELELGASCPSRGVAHIVVRVFDLAMRRMCHPLRLVI